MLLTTALLLTQVTGATNLLTSATVVRDEGVTHSAVVRDGQATWDGDNWNSEGTAIVAKTGLLEWDLGASKPIAAAFLQADNNDVYLLEGSEDGASWQPLWRAPIDSLAGLRTRKTKELKGTARFLRLTASGGDGMYSVSELQVFSSPDDLEPESVVRRPRPPPPPWHLDTGWVVLGVLTVALVWYASSRRQQVLEAEAAAAKAEKAGKKKPADEKDAKAEKDENDAKDAKAPKAEGGQESNDDKDAPGDGKDGESKPS